VLFKHLPATWLYLVDLAHQHATLARHLRSSRPIHVCYLPALRQMFSVISMPLN